MNASAENDIMARFPDGELIDFIASGNLRMFERFCHRWLAQGTTMAAQATSDPHLALDVARRALLRLWQTAPAHLGHRGDVSPLVARFVDEAAREPTVLPALAGKDLVGDIVAAAHALPQADPRGLLSRMIRW